LIGRIIDTRVDVKIPASQNSGHNQNLGLFFLLGSVSVASKTQFQTYLLKRWMQKPKKITALKLTGFVHPWSSLSLKSCSKGFPRMETNISRMWNFEAHQKEQRAVKKLSTDLLDGMSPTLALYQSKRQLSIRQSNLLIPLAV
jgi:hypothetical protein